MIGVGLEILKIPNRIEVKLGTSRLRSEMEGSHEVHSQQFLHSQSLALFGIARILLSTIQG
jgi:hypothetical protein